MKYFLEVVSLQCVIRRFVVYIMYERCVVINEGGEKKIKLVCDCQLQYQIVVFYYCYFNDEYMRVSCIIKVMYLF